MTTSEASRRFAVSGIVPLAMLEDEPMIAVYARRQLEDVAARHERQIEPRTVRWRAS